MKRALERHQAGEARVIPIIVRRCDWLYSPIGALQSPLLDARPISTWKSVDYGWTQVAARLRHVIEALLLLQASTPHSSLPALWMVPLLAIPFSRNVMPSFDDRKPYGL